MGGIVKEWVCRGHGRFDGPDPVCPKAGCTTVERVFITPVGYMGEKSKNMDSTLRKITNDYGLSDLNNQNGTSAARVHSAAAKKAMNQAEAFNQSFKRKFPNARLTPTQHGPGAWGAMQQGGAPATTAAMGAPAENRLAEIKDSLPRKAVVGLRDPDAGSRAKVMNS